MTLGKKIKEMRSKRRLTQADLAGDKITRNMLSAIESDKATPSLDTLRHIANTLEVPLPFLLSEENDLFFYMKKERMPAIRHALETKNYNTCISIIAKIENLDDELMFILAKSYFELGVAATKNGALETAKRHLNLAREYSGKTLYDTFRFESAIPIYLAIAENVTAPLLEFDKAAYAGLTSDSFDYEFYRYLILDFDFNFSNYQLKTHINAKRLIKERRYQDALSLLLDIERTKSEYEYNAYVMFGVYSDLDTCYKQLYDFESAYRFASKRLSLMEAFSS